MKVCLICNKEFKPKRSTAMYCTPECKKQAAKIKGAERRGAQIIESTAEAERITGFKQRQIQSCARGEDKSYRGYLWVY